MHYVLFCRPKYCPYEGRFAEQKQKNRQIVRQRSDLPGCATGTCAAVFLSLRLLLGPETFHRDSFAALCSVSTFTVYKQKKSCNSPCL